LVRPVSAFAERGGDLAAPATESDSRLAWQRHQRGIGGAGR